MKEYIPTNFRFNVLNIFGLIVILWSTLVLTYEPLRQYYIEHHFSILFVKVMFLPILLLLTFVYFTHSACKKRQPVIKIFDEKVIFKYPKLHDFERTITKGEVETISKSKKFIGIRLKNMEDFIRKEVKNYPSLNKDLIFAMFHYFFFKTKGISIKYNQFTSEKKEDQMHIALKIMELNEKKGFHLFLLKDYYPKDFENIFQNLSAYFSSESTTNNHNNCPDHK